VHSCGLTIPEPHDGRSLLILGRERSRRIAAIRHGRYCPGVGQYREHGGASAVRLAVCSKVLRREGTAYFDKLERAGAAMGRSVSVRCRRNMYKVE